MMVLVIVLTVALLILIAVAIVKLNSQKSERDKYYTAAGNIIKEEYLNYCLTNDINSDNKADAPNGQKIMIYIKTLNRKQKAQFVFDPEKGVNIGRDSEKNNIFINEASVSMNHCIYATLIHLTEQFLKEVCSEIICLRAEIYVSLCRGIVSA